MCEKAYIFGPPIVNYVPSEYMERRCACTLHKKEYVTLFFRICMYIPCSSFFYQVC
jgi:hypothetical protein